MDDKSRYTFNANVPRICHYRGQQLLRWEQEQEFDEGKGRDGGGSQLVENARDNDYNFDTTILEGDERTCRDLVEGRAHVDDAPIHTTEESMNRLFGRPNGTTIVNSRDLKEQVRLATSEAASEYRTVRENAKLQDKRAKRGMLTMIVAVAKQKYGVDPRTIISIHTV